MSTEILNIQNINSFNELANVVARGVTLVDFWAPWCGPCRMLSPVFDAVAGRYTENENVKFVKINVDESNELAAQFNVVSVPTLFLFRDGKIVQQFSGVQSENVLEQALTAAADDWQKESNSVSS